MRLVLFVVMAVGVAVLPSLSEGKKISRCEMRDKLMLLLKSTYIGPEFSELNKTVQDYICAKIISKLQLRGLKTSTMVPEEEEEEETEEEENVDLSTDEDKTNETEIAPQTPRVTKPTLKPAAKVTKNDINSNETSASGGSRQKQQYQSEIEKLLNKIVEIYDEEADKLQESNFQVKMYGIWKLSDHYHCESNRRPSVNMCETNCEKFTDDNIDNDFECCKKTYCWVKFLWYNKFDPSEDFFKGCDN